VNPEAVTGAGHAYRDVSGWRAQVRLRTQIHTSSTMLIIPSWRCIKAKFHYAIQVAEPVADQFCDLVEDL